MLNRAVVTQALLDSRGGQIRLVFQALPLVRIAEQGQQPVGQQAHRRFVTGNDQKPAHPQQFFFRKPVPFTLDLHQSSDQVVTRFRAALVGQLFEQHR